MLRLVLLVLAVSGGWATWQSLAEWRSGLLQNTASPDAARKSQLTFAVPAELLPPQRWASVDPHTATDAVLPEATSERRGPDTAERRTASLQFAEDSPAAQPEMAVETGLAGADHAAAALPELPPAERLPEAIQTELKRLGFYRGRVDNIWGPRSRAALRKFAGVHSVHVGDEPTVEVYRAVHGAQPLASAVASAGAAKPGAGQAHNSAHAAKASLETSSYLPPWLSGRDAAPKSEVARMAARGTPAAGSAVRTERRVRQRQAHRRDVRRRTAIQEHFHRNGFLWPGF